MGVTAVNPNGTDTNVSNATSSNITSDQFLLLFVEQLKNQDPLEPMSNTEYITQLAQISLLEQATGLTSMMEKLLAVNINTNDQISNIANQTDQTSQNLLVDYSNLIGKVGYWKNSEETDISGLIKGIIQREHQFFALIDDKEIKIDNIYKVDLGV